MEKKQSKEIDLENITFEDLKEEYKILQVQYKALQTAYESNKQSLEFWMGQDSRNNARIAELRGTLRSVTKLAESELK